MNYSNPNTKPIPILVTLAAAGISCVISIVRGADFSQFFKSLLITVIIFGILGCLIRVFLDMGFKADRKEEEKKEEEAKAAEEGEDSDGDKDTDAASEPEEEKE